MLTSCASTSITRPERDAARHVDGQTLSGELVDDRQAFQRLAIRARIEDEVVRPHVVGGQAGSGTRPTRRHAAARASAWHLEAGLPPEPVGPVDSQHMAGALQEDPMRRYPLPRILPGQVTHRLERRRVAHRQPRLIPKVDRATDSTAHARRLEQAARRRKSDLLPAHAGAYHFFRVISLSTSISRSRSATIFLQPAVLELELP